MDLQPGQFLHGSKFGLEAGTNLTTAGGEGQRNFEWDKTLAAHSRKGVFSTDKEELAWYYADRAAEKDGSRAAVYHVEPSDDVQSPGIYGSEYVSSSAKIKDRIDIKPGRQGTLPLNWGQFNPLRADAFNHPTDADEELGHTRSTFNVERPMTAKDDVPRSLEDILGKRAPRLGDKTDPMQGRLF